MNRWTWTLARIALIIAAFSILWYVVFAASPSPPERWVGDGPVIFSSVSPPFPQRPTDLTESDLDSISPAIANAIRETVADGGGLAHVTTSELDAYYQQVSRASVRQGGGSFVLVSYRGVAMDSHPAPGRYL